MNRVIAEFLTNKCIRSMRFYEPKIKVFDTALEVLKFHWPNTYINTIRHYESYMSKTKYVSASKSTTGYRFYKNTYQQQSLAGITTMKLFGLATRPEISVTYEGQSMKDFTFTIFHEIAHVFYNTLDEVVANSFAVLYNKILWEPKYEYCFSPD